jgi:cobalamin biosynthesis protein CobT
MNAALKIGPFSAKQHRDGWMSFLRVLAQDSKLEFAVGHPSTNGKKIYLPALPAELTSDDLIMFKRFGYHEVGHVLHSNVEYFKAFGKEHGRNAQFLLNALDDPYMEAKQARFSRAAERYFREGIEIMTRKKLFRDGSASPFEAICCYCLTSLGARKWTEFAESAQVVRDNVHKHFGEHADQLLENLDEILFREFPNVRCTEDAGALTLRIIEMLKQQGQQDEQEQEQEQPKDDDEGSDKSEGASGAEADNSNQESDPSGTNAPEATDPNQSSTKSGNAGGDEEDEEGGNGGNGSSINQAPGDHETVDQNDGTGDEGGEGKPTLAEIIEQMLEEEVEEGEVFDGRKYIEELAESVDQGTNPEYKGQQAVPAFDVDGTPVSQQSSLSAGKGVLVEGMPVSPVDRENLKEMESCLDRKFQVLAAKLQSLLLSREEAEVYDSHRGQLGQAHLYRLGLGNSRIFQQQEEVERVSAAVTLLADLSGSTLNFPFEQPSVAARANDEDELKRQLGQTVFGQIQQSLLIMEKMLDQLGNPREILGFAPRTGELTTMVRTFGDDHLTAAQRVAGLTQIVGGAHTPIGEAVFQAAGRLLSHEAQRKVMFVLTDGEPSDRALAKEHTEAAMQAGITVVYILIGEQVACDWLKEMGCPYVHVKNSAELCPVLLDQAEALLM